MTEGTSSVGAVKMARATVDILTISDRYERRPTVAQEIWVVYGINTAPVEVRLDQKKVIIAIGHDQWLDVIADPSVRHHWDFTSPREPIFHGIQVREYHRRDLPLDVAGALAMAIRS